MGELTVHGEELQAQALTVPENLAKKISLPPGDVESLRRYAAALVNLLANVEATGEHRWLNQESRRLVAAVAWQPPENPEGGIRGGRSQIRTVIHMAVMSTIHQTTNKKLPAGGYA